MLGFLIGIGSLIGLIAVLRAGRRGRCGGAGWGGHGWHHHGRRGGWGGWNAHHGGGGPRTWLRFLFERLETTPGQEKEIAAAVEELVAKAKELREEGNASRNDVAKVLRQESLDENALGELFSRHDDRLRDVQKAFAGALGRIHNALEPDQRARLAEMIESAPRGFGFGGPYRGWV
jgi:hypothetical protein